MADARLYLVTGAHPRQGNLEVFLQTVLTAGVDMVQLREKDAEAGDLLSWGAVFRAAAARHGALFIVNDRPDVALALDADGVHLGQNDLPAQVARGILGPGRLIGLSTHSAADLASVAPEVDYLCAGPVYETPTKPGRTATGLELITQAAARERDGSERRPWFAIGGIDATTLPAVLAQGARRIVVVRAITEAADPAASARGLRARLEHAPSGCAASH